LESQVSNTAKPGAPGNGFGLAIEKAEREVRVVEAGMTLLPDSETTYREWQEKASVCVSRPYPMQIGGDNQWLEQ
jgi:hypothetical protein